MNVLGKNVGILHVNDPGALELHFPNRNDAPDNTCPVLDLFQLAPVEGSGANGIGIMARLDKGSVRGLAQTSNNP